MSDTKVSTIVLLHGWGSNHRVWDTVESRLPAEWKIIAIDLPGYNGSTFLPSLANLDALTRHLVDVIPRGSIWIGWSLGGLLAMNAAVRFPQHVAGLVPVAATPRFIRADDWNCGVEEELFQHFATSLHADLHSVLRRFIGLMLLGGEGAASTRRTMQKYFLDQEIPALECLRTGLEMLLRSDLRNELEQVSCPTMLIFGGRDKLVPAATAEAVTRLLPGATSRIMADAAHVPFLSHPAQFRRYIVEFLDERF